MLVLYVATSFAIWLAFQLVRGGIDRAKLKEFDQQLGAVFGLIKGVVLCVVITFFAVTLLGEDLRRKVIDSRSGLYIARLIDRADRLMPHEIHEFLDPYLNELDERLGQPPSPSAAPAVDDFQDWEKYLQRPGRS